jgi:ubiquinone/menaquinone biosynthesis C-methylase UbiE
MTATDPSPTLDRATDPLTERTRATWTAGDFGRIATSYARGADDFIARPRLNPGEQVLDVACGTGNLALPAARTGALVTGIDIAPNLIAQARANATRQGLPAAFDVGDAEDMPYEDRSFATVVTMFGAMFTPRPERAAAELLRVTRPGGRIAMASWTPTGFIGEMFKTVGRFVPPPAGVPSPLLWGSEQVVRERLGAEVTSLAFERRLITFEFPFSPSDVVDCFHLYYGPTVRAFAALEPSRRDELRRALDQSWTEHNEATDGTTRVRSEYLEAIAVVG